MRAVSSMNAHPPVVPASPKMTNSIRDNLLEESDAYVAAFEQALDRVPAPIRRGSVADLEEELSWLDTRGTKMLFAALGTPQEAARRVIRKLAADRLRRRRAIGISTARIGILGLTLLVSVLSVRASVCSSKHNEDV